jgi:hypothetical protein
MRYLHWSLAEGYVLPTTSFCGAMGGYLSPVLLAFLPDTRHRPLGVRDGI